MLIFWFKSPLILAWTTSKWFVCLQFCLSFNIENLGWSFIYRSEHVTLSENGSPSFAMWKASVYMAKKVLQDLSFIAWKSCISFALLPSADYYYTEFMLSLKHAKSIPASGNTCFPLCLEYSSWYFIMAQSFLLFMSLLKCHLFRKDFPDYFIKNSMVFTKGKKKCIRQSYAGKDVIQAYWNRRGHIRIWHQLHWNKRNRIFKSWVKGEFTDHLSLLIGFTQRNSKLSLLFVTGGSCTAWSKMPTWVRLLLSHRDWEAGLLWFLLITFQRDGSQVVEKDCLGMEHWQEGV